MYSLAVVPGSEVFDTTNVPHGAVASVYYHSTALGGIRRMHVYTPPGYETNRERYPVFYLLHGAGDVDDSWSSVGRAGFILDNLIAVNKAKPMIVVMPAGHVNGAGAAWSIGDSEADLRSDGRLELDVQGLIVTVRGNNPLKQFKAIVSCQSIVNGAPAVTNVTTDAFDANTAGDAQTETNVDLPSPCLAPIVFVTTPGGSWIAVTGR